MPLDVYFYQIGSRDTPLCDPIVELHRLDSYAGHMVERLIRVRQVGCAAPEAAILINTRFGILVGGRYRVYVHLGKSIDSAMPTQPRLRNRIRLK